VNLSLLAKWRWRLLSNEHAVWKDVLISKYGSLVVGQPVLGDEVKLWFASSWWKDICSIGVNLNLNWFSSNVVKKLGNGVHTRFWSDIWVGDVPLRDRFPRLFSISSQKEGSVADFRRVINGTFSWDFIWRRRFFVWEQDLLHELLAIINPVNLSVGDDRWGWVPEGGGPFSVKSTYLMVFSLAAPVILSSQWHGGTFSSIWKCPAPSKVCGFTWQLLHGRIPTRHNLLLRRVIPDGGDVSCVLCGESVETELHLFLYCEVAMLVWLEIFAWLQIPFNLPHNLFSIFNSLIGDRNKKVKRGFIMICCSVVWCLWKWRNSVLFDNLGGVVAELVEKVKVVSWKWWISDSSKFPCLFY
jgi:hypothetical protein